MHRLLQYSITLLAVGLLAGCEWEGSGDSDSFNSVDSWVNFGGVYRPVAGQTYLVSLHAPLPSTPASVESRSESIGSGNGLLTAFSGTLGGTPVVLGSLTVTDGVETFLENPAGSGSLAGNMGGAGSVNYQTGAINVSFAFAPGNVSIIAKYQYAAAGTPASPAPGSSALIYSLAVDQTGNKLYMTDNNGVRYSGVITSLSGAGGGGAASATAGEIVANFEVSGPNSIRITGTFQGDYTPGAAAAGTATLGTLANRVMHGTWVEPSITGDVQGTAGSTTITF